MENTTEDDVSSTANHSFSGSGAAASGESGWTTYIDYFMETQQQHEEGSGACTATPSTNNTGGRSTSEHIGRHGGDGGAVASFGEGARLLPALMDPSQVWKRLNFRKEERISRRKKLMYDESLEDTATSPISSPKLIDSRDSDDKHKKKEDGCDEICHCKKTTDELARDDHTINDNAAKSRISDDAYGHNELRKKGLCLVPVTVFQV